MAANDDFDPSAASAERLEMLSNRETTALYRHLSAQSMARMCSDVGSLWRVHWTEIAERLYADGGYQQNSVGFRFSHEHASSHPELPPSAHREVRFDANPAGAGEAKIGLLRVQPQDCATT